MLSWFLKNNYAHRNTIIIHTKTKLESYSGTIVFFLHKLQSEKRKKKLDQHVVYGIHETTPR